MMTQMKRVPDTRYWQEPETMGNTSTQYTGVQVDTAIWKMIWKLPI